ncbi:TIGR01777 family oxidoreductase [uncultured Draconibacterium sp.]|uniref:TIGR01777 family oxidoreductase n=1 Tax=uncultured Draconibacterium sp. TaxID=1573823 RepID=UPI0029C95A03|nr:TIGR01777 family oxidoreductase [uncultured Draconibacterium sp.]
MKIKLTGSNGYIGQLISTDLQKKGHAVSGINRDLLYAPSSSLQEELRNTDVVINLAGAPILQRWTKKNKETIYNSRVVTTHNLVKAIIELPESERPGKVISASAIGIYKSGDSHTEESINFDEGFVGKVVKDWEHELTALPGRMPTIIFRLGVVFGKESQTIKNMLLPFKLGLGGKIGSGEQSFPFIHEKDVVNAFVWATETLKTSDTFNLTAPETISNKEFTRNFARQVNRPAFFTIPTFALKMLFGKAASLLTASPQVSSTKLQKAGFYFEYPTIKDTLQNIIVKSQKV